ncbi:hypothetical protein HK099_001428 [Clydaea vesicula]|uniref:BSD domain-containing protein n=1 Tax=Clydaea vesicula TaxID=447962 RepID=A0AAD5U8T3_9FUNG|nr:hypothetical protein HK099_001428 [Clydaea vesicula]
MNSNKEENASIPEQPSTIFSWSWGSLVDSIKKQTDAISTVLESDLKEFVTVVSNESSHSMDNVKEITAKSLANLSNMKILDSKDDNFENEVDEELQLDDEISNIDVLDNEEVFLLPGEAAKVIGEKLGNTAQNLISNISMGLSSIINTSIQISAPEESREEKKKLKTAALASIRLDPSTYQLDPLQSADVFVVNRFQDFLKNFNVNSEEISAEIENLLATDENLDSFLNNISGISRDECWLRYFFAVSEFDFLSENRKKLIKDVVNEKEENFCWDSSSDEECSTAPIISEGLGLTANKGKNDEGSVTETAADLAKEVEKLDEQNCSEIYTENASNSAVAGGVNKMQRQTSHDFEVVDKISLVNQNDEVVSEKTTSAAPAEISPKFSVEVNLPNPADNLLPETKEECSTVGDSDAKPTKEETPTSNSEGWDDWE